MESPSRLDQHTRPDPMINWTDLGLAAAVGIPSTVIAATVWWPAPEGDSTDRDADEQRAQLPESRSDKPTV